MRKNIRRIKGRYQLNLRGAGKLAIIVMALIIAISLLMTGCLRSPVETGAVTNTEGADVTPGENDDDEDPTITETEPETSTTVDSDETTEDEGSETSETVAPDKEERPLESTITIELEGMPEEIVTSLYMSESGYSMYYDKDRYKVVETSGRFDAAVSVDEYMPVTPADALPDIYMQVGHSADTAADMLAMLREQAETKLNAQANQAESVLIGVDKLPGQRIHVVAGNEWDSEVIDITVVDDGTGGSFFFYGGYFLEAGEGHGSRYLQMMESFRIE